MSDATVINVPTFELEAWDYDTGTLTTEAWFSRQSEAEAYARAIAAGGTPVAVTRHDSDSARVVFEDNC